MLFNSTEFLLAFLPITFFLFLLLKRVTNGRVVLLFISMSSLFFYGWWAFEYLLLMVGSIIFNYTMGRFLLYRNTKALIVFGVCVNLAALGWFKYFNFFVENLEYISGYDFNLGKILLPLGISFFTFQQIMYLVDTYRHQTKACSFIEYLTFVTFFPQLIAGPIVHHGDMISQFQKIRQNLPYDWSCAAIGIALFSIGLFKKVLLADTFAMQATPVFTLSDQGEAVGFVDSWIAALSYTLQIYFDFSAYSDMAIGLGLLFGIRLPINFLSPYKAVSIVDFWRRWHITLSRFLKDYLYIPLGGNRKGEIRRYTNLTVTMILGGIWHGAGWNFLIWGAVQGFYLVVNHIWIKSSRIALNRYFSWGITMLCIVFAWVFFRSETFLGAWRMVFSMLSFSGNSDANSVVDDPFLALGLIIGGFIVALCTPNAIKIVSYQSNSEALNARYGKRWLALTVAALWCSMFTIIYNKNRVSEFIYFQF